MKKLLIIIDMQNDFIDGSLANPAAQAIVPGIVDLIKSWDGKIGVTLDTHFNSYLTTQEGKNLPIPHCISDTKGHKLNKEIADAMGEKAVYFIYKPSFGFTGWNDYALDKHFDEITLVGTCTDICVVSNALMLKSCYPETKIRVIGSLCAGLTPEKHEAALEVMRSCQIEVI